VSSFFENSVILPISNVALESSGLLDYRVRILLGFIVSSPRLSSSVTNSSILSLTPLKVIPGFPSYILKTFPFPSPDLTSEFCAVNFLLYTASRYPTESLFMGVDFIDAFVP